MDLLCQSMCIYLFVLSLSISSKPNIYVYILLTGQSVDNNFQLCWKLFLDSLLFHCSGCILHLSIMENEQCKARTYYLSVSEITYSIDLLYLLVAGTTHNIPAYSCLFPLLSCCIEHDTTSVTTFSS
jgi:hypothetical protein